MSPPKLQVFVWSELFETGVELIDSQHQTLVDLTNQLGEAVVRSDVAQGQAVLDRLKAYTQYHFEAEEAWSVQAGQPPQALAAHRASHAGFLTEVLKFADGWTGSDERAHSLHRFLTAWLITHILGEDRNMVRRLSLQQGSALATPSELGDGEKVLLEATHNLHEALSAMAQGLERQVQERTAELERAAQQMRANFLTGVRTFTSLMELRGGMLAGHSRRVADLARKMALHLQLAPAMVQQVFMGGLLHDIGKIGLPDDLLGKPVTRMSSEELRMYRGHSVNGEAALIAMSELHGAAHAVRSHHERWDGRGYPDGLAGERIPLEARLVAVANDLDSLQHGIITTRRLSMDEALAIIQASSGERYDPQMVDALTCVLGRAGAVDSAQPPADRVVTCSMLQPGMRLARDLVTREGMLLLAADHSLEAQTIARIQHFLSSGAFEDFKVYVQPSVESVD
jgi:hemerythrin-like metal-binding protein